MQEAGNRRFVAVAAQQGNDIEKRRSLGIASPLGVGQIVRGATWAKALQRSQQQQTIRSYREGRMPRYGLLAPDLRLSYSQQIFFITMIDFNLPAIKTSLDQQLSRLAIVSARVRGKLVRHRSDHEQSQSAPAAAAFPQHTLHLFILQQAPRPTEINPSSRPRTILLLAQLFGSEYLLIVFATRAFRSGKAEPCIFAAASEQLNTLQSGLEHRLIREAAITDNQQHTSAAVSLIYAEAQIANQFQGLRREILFFFQAAILLALCFSGALARLLERRRFLKADRNSARWMIAFLVVWEQQRGLYEAQAINKVYVKGWRQRIALPAGAFNLLARLAQLGVVNSSHYRRLRIALEVLIDHRSEQLLWPPVAARKHLVISTPVTVAAAQSPKCARNSAAPQYTGQGHGVLDGTAARAGLRKYRLPAALQEGVKLLQQHHSPPFRAKTFLSVRTKRAPRLTFLTSVETIDSRSSLKPCSFSTRSMISETWSGLPARRSTSCTMSICDVPLRAALGSRGPARRRFTALSWASSETSSACSTALSISSFSIAASSAPQGLTISMIAENAITEVRMSTRTMTYVL